MIKSLTLTIEEIRQLIEITDAEAQRQILQSLSDNEQEDINPDNYSDAHPMALTLATKIHRKEKSAERRREKRAQQSKRASDKEKERIKNQPMIEARKNDFITIDLDESTVRRLLWLKQNHPLWLKAIKCIVYAINGSGIPTLITKQLLDNIDALFTYISPLINQAADYHLTPRRFRPHSASAQIPA